MGMLSEHVLELNKRQNQRNNNVKDKKNENAGLNVKQKKPKVGDALSCVKKKGTLFECQCI